MSSVHDYFPAAPTMPVFVHHMSWAGSPGHGAPYFNYMCDDPAVAKADATEIKSWGCDGVIVDWYGDYPQFRQQNRATALMYQNCLALGMKFTVAIDAGCLQSSTNPTQDFIDLVAFYGTFFPDPAARIMINGKATILEFGMESLKMPIDWNKVFNRYPNLNILHRNVNGFSVPNSAGSYAWIDAGEPYLDDYYKRANSLSQTKICFGSLFAGFDDRKRDQNNQIIVPNVNVWGKTNPDGSPNITVIDPENGQTFLDTVQKANDFMKAGGKLSAMVINTYDDMQEGSQTRGGIPVKTPSPAVDMTVKPLFVVK